MTTIVEPSLLTQWTVPAHMITKVLDDNNPEEIADKLIEALGDQYLIIKQVRATLVANALILILLTKPHNEVKRIIHSLLTRFEHIADNILRLVLNFCAIQKCDNEPYFKDYPKIISNYVYALAMSNNFIPMLIDRGNEHYDELLDMLIEMHKQGLINKTAAYQILIYDTADYLFPLLFEHVNVTREEKSILARAVLDHNIKRQYTHIFDTEFHQLLLRFTVEEQYDYLESLS